MQYNYIANNQFNYLVLSEPAFIVSKQSKVSALPVKANEVYYLHSEDVTSIAQGSFTQTYKYTDVNKSLQLVNIPRSTSYRSTYNVNVTLHNPDIINTVASCTINVGGDGTYTQTFGHASNVSTTFTGVIIDKGVNITFTSNCPADITLSVYYDWHL